MIRRQWDIRLLRRHAFKSHSSSSPFRRHTSSKNKEPYILPRLVIDLDANDNQFVREATKEDYAVPERPPRWRQRDERAVRDGLPEEELQLSSRMPFAFDTSQVTALDLMRYTLFGSPYDSSDRRDFQRRKQFRDLKIHPFDNADTKVKRLTHTFTIDASKVLEGAGFLPERQPQILEQLQTITLFPPLRRMLKMLTSTIEGCVFLAAQGEHVVAAISRCSRSRDSKSRDLASVGQILILLNNLYLNMESRGVAYGSHLCNAALYYASRKFYLSSVRKYLDILRAKSYVPTPQAFETMQHLVMRHRRGPAFHSLKYRHTPEDERLREVLKILTGWESGGIPQHGETRKACFEPHTMIPGTASPRIVFSEAAPSQAASLEARRYGAYIAALGYIGASDAVWHEWCNPSHEPNILLQHRDPAIAESFALAFLMAKDPNRSLHVLQPLFNDDQHDPWKQPVGHEGPKMNVLEPAIEDSPSPESDSRSNSSILSPDIIANQPLTKTIQLSDVCYGILNWYHSSNNLTPTQRFQERLKANFSPDKPETILQVMDDFLVPDWLEYKEFTSASFDDTFADYDIDWVKKDGVEGAAIRRAGDEEVIYFKASSRRGSSPGTETSSDSSRSSVDEQ